MFVFENADVFNDKVIAIQLSYSTFHKMRQYRTIPIKRPEGVAFCKKGAVKGLKCSNSATAKIQLNFNGSNTFGTITISSRQA